MQILSALGGGLWIIPLLTSLGAIFFFIRAYRASRSGSVQQTKTGLVESDENVPIYKTGWFIFGVALTLATVGIVIWMNLEK